MVTTSPPLSGPLLRSWLCGAIASVALPLLIFFCIIISSDDTYDAKTSNDDKGDSSSSADGRAAPPPVVLLLLVTTYVWSLLVFFGMVYYGYHTMRAGTDLHGIVVALVLFTNYGCGLLLSATSTFVLFGSDSDSVNSGAMWEGATHDGFAAGQFVVMVRGVCAWRDVCVKV